MSSTNTEDGDTQFTPEEKQRYRRPKTLRLVFDLSLSWIQAILACSVFIIYPSVWSWLICVMIIAGAQHGLSMISHEAAHRLIWPQDHRINDRIGTYLFAAPALLPFNVYRQRHFIHHRLVSQQNDTKTFYRRDVRGWRFLIEILRSLSGLDYILQAVEAMRHGKQEGNGEKSKQFKANLRHDQRAIIAVHGIIFLVFLTVDPLHAGIPTYYFILWLWPLLTLSFLLGKLRSLAEHQPPRADNTSAANTATPYFLNTPGPMLRSVHATWLERLFLSKINFHYHAEHHLWPWISYQYLPEVNCRLWQDEYGTRTVKNNQVSIEENYCRVLANKIRGA
ncbi:fatty acid desaturase [Oceanicoccus sp. KOV_DT_Chl]|uniref:fatty acid desaturase family protein n=1 Tax=Oceanicoccus sp. KOV_DT_Chl TaxID=1904639 RepID=UPI00135805D3|nr:fatty acid desaturase [Oceanicoccus sp. KOV_DT_Chl]